jgi:hypothetical protein
MSAWQITDDVKLIAELSNEARTRDLLEATSTLYTMRFEKCFSLFEELLREIRNAS